MPLLILFTLIAVPYLEFLVFLEVGGAIGGFQAFLLTVLTAVLGIYLIKKQGLVVLNRMRETLQRGESPMEDISHGFFLLIAGLFFLLPGFITDTFALLLALGPVRVVLGKMIVNNIGTSFYKNRPGPNQNSQKGQPHDKGIIIEGEYEENPDDQKNIDHKE